jgi:hypothetical protein
MFVEFDFLFNSLKLLLIIFLLYLKAVVCAVVNVICELARKNPKNYLSLAPQLFNILNTSTNNWMLIKIIKLVIY